MSLLLLLRSEMIPDTYQSIGEALLLFGGSVLLAVPAGVLLDALRLLRRLVPHHPAAVAAEDILWVLAVCLLLLLYASGFAKGVFRGCYAAGCFLGIVLYVCTVGRAVMGILELLLRLLAVPVRAVRRGYVLICKKVKWTFVKTSKKHRKGTENAKNHLQVPHGMLYNEHRKKSALRSRKHLEQKGNPYGKKRKTTR